MKQRYLGFTALMTAAALLTGCLAWFGPSVDFEASTVEGPQPVVVQFTPVSEESLVSCSWSFGDGETSDDLSPVHIYRAAGTYTVTLAAEFVDGTVATVKKPDLIAVHTPMLKGEPEYIYWIDWHMDRAGIWRGLASGGEKEQLVALDWITTWPIPEALAVDDEWVYYDDEDRRCICRVRTDGSEREVLIPDQEYVTDLEVVPETNAILWVVRPYDSGGTAGSRNGGIYMAFLDQLEPLTVVSYKPDAEWYADQIEVDALGGKTYWSKVHEVPSECHAAIRVTTTSGFAPTTLQGGICPPVYGLAVDTMSGYAAEYVYWKGFLDSWIYRCRTDGSGVEQVCEKPNCTFLTVDRLDGKLYLIAGRGIERANLDGSEHELLYNGAYFTAVAVPE